MNLSIIFSGLGSENLINFLYPSSMTFLLNFIFILQTVSTFIEIFWDVSSENIPIGAIFIFSTFWVLLKSSKLLLLASVVFLFDWIISYFSFSLWLLTSSIYSSSNVYLISSKQFSILWNLLVPKFPSAFIGLVSIVKK